MEKEFDLEEAIKAYQRTYARYQFVDPDYARHCLTMIDLLKMDQMEGIISETTGG
ncbi:hypothetical protein [Bradyrhizobium sp. 6(2017)]|uniref:hypothetical protein n=1 Tax=Bradyrhizobium sp. 6(2017) TaxID=1197460 RepID=UPI0013E1B111|nr:hypothetical protein [Bradyrhizobium sp. 6(2017)]QIG92151.1 hypothetical protein G6P99_06290 [Bradyrhizobium sp. 6(2017)]